jgi:hypothetical protein
VLRCGFVLMSVVHDLVLEFVECAVHQLLCTRRIYPECSNPPFGSILIFHPVDLFERKAKYGISLWRSKNDEINHYIKRVLRNSSNLIINVSCSMWQAGVDICRG